MTASRTEAESFWLPEQVGPPDPQQRPVDRLLTLGYAATILLSAFLLFEVQPIVGKIVLPWFGGTPGVWTTCQLVFQVLLFAGYAYAHLVVTKLRPGAQAALHAALLLAAAVVLPILPNPDWKPTGSEPPVPRIVLTLVAAVGLPFLLLSTTGPLLQGWFSRTHRGRSPYRLYALSNAGSLLALVTYPFLVEPRLGLTRQAHVWSGLFVAFALGAAFCAWRMARDPNADFSTAAVPEGETAGAGERPTTGARLLWFALAAVPSALLLATTNQVCLDVASVPFLWLLPLTLYLSTFILCFESDRWYSRRLCLAALCVLLPGTCVVLFRGAHVAISLQVTVHVAAFFCGAMLCHGELARLRPAPRHLTAFYLTMSAGGAAGGLFVGLAAPVLFPTYLEFHLAWVACTGLVLLVMVIELRRSRAAARAAGEFRSRIDWMPIWLFGLGTLGLAVALAWQAVDSIRESASLARSFFGVLRVKEWPTNGNPTQRQLVNGRILHGKQYTDPEFRRWPTTYYGEQSGIGRLLKPGRAGEPTKVGMIGLGVGTIAAYGRKGDAYRFYEIDPVVERIAREQFDYLGDSPAECTVHLGDGRLTLEREEPQDFDVLAVDAFSGDAIPTHLLTDAACDIYLRHLRPDGVLAIHVSNRHFDLRPVVRGLAEHGKLHVVSVESDDDDDRGVSRAEWLLLSRSEGALDRPGLHGVGKPLGTESVTWTDDHADVFRILRSQKSSAGKNLKDLREKWLKWWNGAER